MIHFVSFFFDHWLFHPLVGRGYQWWSGIAGCLGYLSVLVGLGGLYKHHQCEEKRCWRPGHLHPDHGRPVCRKHYTTHVPPLAGPGA